MGDLYSISASFLLDGLICLMQAKGKLPTVSSLFYIKKWPLFGATIVFGCSFHESFESVGLQRFLVRRQAKHHIARTRITAVIPYPRNPGKFLKPIFKTCCLAKMFLSCFFFSLHTLFFKTTCKHTNSPFIN